MTGEAPPLPPGPPRRRRPRPFRFPDFQVQELDGGLRLFLLEERRLPLLQLQLVTGGGAHFESLSEAGTATLTASLIDEGTASSDALGIARRIESLGASFASYGDWEALHLSATLLARDQDAALDLLAEVATEPTFPADELERLRRMRLAELQRRRSQPGTLAAERLAAVLYGGSPYGHPLLGTEAAMAAIRRRDVVRFYRRHVAAGRAALLAVGDFDATALTARARAAFGRWSPADAAPPPVIEPAPRGGITVDIVDRPGAAQTELRLGHAGSPRLHPDHLPLQVMATLLGGKFTSRINLSLRERHSLTYGAWSRWTERSAPGPFVVGAAVDSARAGLAVREVLAELRRLQDEEVAPEELEETRDYMLGVFPYTLQTLAGLAGRLEELAVFSLPEDYFRRYPRALAAVGAAEILGAARRHLRPEEVAVVAVGPAEVLRPQLEPLGPVRVASPPGPLGAV